MGMVALAMAAVGAISAMSQNQQKAQQAARQEATRTYNNRLAAMDLVGQTNAITQQKHNSRERGMEALIQNQISSAKAAGSASAQAGASGVAGGSVSAVINDINTEAGRNTGKIVANQHQELQSLYLQGDANALRYQSRFNPYKVEGPSKMEQFMNVGMGAMKGYMGGANFGSQMQDFSGGGQSGGMFSFFGQGKN